MDHRTGLRGTETGTRVGTLRRKRLARISPSRAPLHRSVRIPGSRAEPFFPLNSRRPCWITSPEAPAGLPAARRRDAFAPNGIILNPSQVYVLRLRGTYQVSFPIVRFAARFVYNTVVLVETLRRRIAARRARARDDRRAILRVHSLPGAAALNSGTLFQLSARK